MPSVNATLLIASSILAGVLVLIGVWIGRRKPANKTIVALPPVVDEDDRQRIVELLQSLTRWTNEYSGNVSNYQSDLRQISQDVRQNLQAARRDLQSSGAARDEAQILSDSRLLTLVTTIMSTNEELQTRLVAAEKQLEQQTHRWANGFVQPTRL